MLMLSCIVVVIVLVVLLLYYLFPIAEVHGKSMLPTLQEGDSLLATRLCNRGKGLEEGGIYIIKRGDRKAIKRLTHIYNLADETFCYFLGDNPSESYDSRHYGYVNAKDIVAKVLWQLKH